MPWLSMKWTKNILFDAQWRLKSPASRLFIQLFIQEQIKENIKAPRHWPLCAEFTGDRWIPRSKGQQRGKCFHLMMSSWCQWNESSSVQVLVWHQCSLVIMWTLITKMPTCNHLDPYQLNSEKFESNANINFQNDIFENVICKISTIYSCFSLWIHCHNDNLWCVSDLKVGILTTLGVSDCKILFRLQFVNTLSQWQPVVRQWQQSWHPNYSRCHWLYKLTLSKLKISLSRLLTYWFIVMPTLHLTNLPMKSSA